MSLPLEECQARIEKAQGALDAELASYRDEIHGINQDMAKLKALLYGKFGKTINLEKD